MTAPSLIRALDGQNREAIHLSVLGVADPRAHARSDSTKGGDEMTFRNYLDLLRNREEGQTMAEYGVVLAVITIAGLAAFQLLGGSISNAINQVAGMLPG